LDRQTHGLVRAVDDRPSVVCQLPFVNPVTGAFSVEGAQPGDTLAIHVVSITAARDWAVSATFPHFGALTSTHTTATLQPPLEERVWLYEVDHTVELPLEPMHGTIGVAPAASEVRSTIVADAHGGNLDTPEVRAGVTAYFGVNVPGAMFAIGDGHARQGGGEVCGVAVEAAMTTVLAVDVVKGVSTPWPRLESETHLMSIGAARPLEDAYRIAQHDLVPWLAEKYLPSPVIAYGTCIPGCGNARPLGHHEEAMTAMPGLIPPDGARRVLTRL